MNIVLAYDREKEIRELVVEYTDMIIKPGNDVKECLSSQNLDEELKDMKNKYSLPYGRMYLAIVKDEAAGCVALTKNDNEYCEIKRLYVRPKFRGKGISKALTEQVISDARKIGYKYMRLDTFPFMSSAIKLYEKYGFRIIDRYNDNPAKTAIFMQLDL
ncbi:GNAT family N-acetyltransferase [Terrisporobacter petrolearius]|uniref:GNAT family N-acetyltransferase n=1 Tax=Terrisporobacter petrolearius TaxID=1460447 RepID=UPI003B003E85